MFTNIFVCVCVYYTCIHHAIIHRSSQVGWKRTNSVASFNYWEILSHLYRWETEKQKASKIRWKMRARGKRVSQPFGLCSASCVHEMMFHFWIKNSVEIFAKVFALPFVPRILFIVIPAKRKRKYIFYRHVTNGE